MSINPHELENVRNEISLVAVNKETTVKSIPTNTIISSSRKSKKIANKTNSKTVNLATTTVVKPVAAKNKNSVISYNLLNASNVATSTNFTTLHLNSNLFNQGMFYGFALTIILLNLVCYFVFDETLFTLFSLTFAAITATLFFTEGLYPLLGLTEVIQPQILQSTLLVFAIGLLSYFSSKYLVVKDFYNKMYYITIPLVVIATFLVGTAWATKNVIFSNIANTVLFGLASIYFVIGILLFSKKNYAKFYVIASAIPLLFLVDFYVLQNFGIDFLFTEAVHIKVAVFFEALLISYAILYRMQAVKEEGLLRQTEMRIFLKRQDVMSRNKVEEMIEDIYLENLIMQYDLDGFEIKLLQYISEGKTNAKIARKLKISENELGEVTKELYQKLEISEQIKEDHRMIDQQPDFIYN